MEVNLIFHLIYYHVILINHFLGGMPDLSALMNNPMFASMAQNLMSNPEALQGILNIVNDTFGTLTTHSRPHEQPKIKRNGPGSGRWRRRWYARY